MPDITKVDLSWYRFQKAEEMLTSAKRDMEAKDFASANNRAYYAIFHTMLSSSSVVSTRKSSEIARFRNFFFSFLKSARQSPPAVCPAGGRWCGPVSASPEDLPAPHPVQPPSELPRIPGPQWPGSHSTGPNRCSGRRGRVQDTRGAGDRRAASFSVRIISSKVLKNGKGGPVETQVRLCKHSKPHTC